MDNRLSYAKMEPTLPTAIWWQICETIADNHACQPEDDWQSRSSLRNLSLVSREISGIAQRYMFQYYNFSNGRNSGKNLVAFLRVITKDASLAACVREIFLAHWVQWEDDDKEVKAELAEIYQHIAARFGFSVDTFPSGIGDEEEDLPAVAQIMIPLLPNLKSCTVETRGSNPVCGTLVRLHDAGNLASFSSIDVFTTEWGDTENCCGLAEYLPLLRLMPNVKMLRLQQFGGLGFEEIAEPARNAIRDSLPRSLKKLEINWSGIEEDELHLLLQLCPRLLSFTYSSGGACIYDGDEEITPVQAVRALRAVKDTIRYIDLEFYQHMDYHDLDDLSTDDLAGFPVLETFMLDHNPIFPAAGDSNAGNNDGEIEDAEEASNDE